MASQQLFLVCDSSTLANFKQWAQAVSAWMSTCGYTQTSDTGQVNWSSIASVPGSGAYVYEIWASNDGLTTYYLKIEYGNVSGTNCPGLAVTMGTGSNGSGALTGFVTQRVQVCASSYTPSSTTLQYECDFSGGAGRLCVLMWRNGTVNQQQFFAVERSVNSTGAYTGTHVTILFAGYDAGEQPRHCFQATIVFGVGVAPNSLMTTQAAVGTSQFCGWLVRMSAVSGPSNNGLSAGITNAFNQSIPFDTVSPCVGFWDWQLTCCGVLYNVDGIEGLPFAVTLYGSTRTYLPSKAGPLAAVSPGGNARTSPSGSAMLCMRYD